ncbi:Chaperone protein DnaJ [Candidatus Hodgkinia cicadicola]|uniref:Chaperone protein DnaJ n=1 Tax=Candidatus Hodgkinia cicadicola TaxID=573658 RepID=A0ABX4MHX0_9HYPH|nr:Chaperone protein DnaJ [Candidatus Hodgkinia cicadicola]PIM96495.1 Chaperone protein DnaJ [Candidatus Hodgkinia cicadicola]
MLGITKDVNNDQVKKAYHKLSMKYHPDLVNKTNSRLISNLKDINNAYNILKHDKTRGIYDKFHEGTNCTSESFDRMFDSSTVNKKSNKLDGRDIYLKYAISLEQLNEKRTIGIEYETFIECLKCKNKGWVITTGSVSCNYCKGYGTNFKKEGIIVNINSCLICKGRGKINVLECLGCNGSGRLVGKRDVKLEINALTKEGCLICFNKRGEAGTNTGLVGNLYIKMIVKSHEFYIRNNLNLYCIVRIKPMTAIVGGNVVLKTTTKSLVVIPIPTKKEENIYLEEKGKGLEGGNGDVGNIFIKLMLKCNVYGNTLSVDISTNTLIILYRINKMLEVILLKN